MKNKFYFSLLFFASLCCFSCDDFLIEKPKSIYSSKGDWENEESLRLLLLGVYDSYYTLYRKANPDQYGYIGLVGEAGSEEMICNPWSQVASTLYGYTGNPDDAFKVYQHWYSYHYNVISRANNVIEHASNVIDKTEGIKRIIAEAKTLRAWSYFRLAQTFGPTQILLDVVKPPVNYALERRPLKEVYEQIVKDLKEATDEKVMFDTNKNVSEPGRLTHWTALAMLGKVYLTMASSKEAGVIDRNLATIGKESYGYGEIEQSVDELYLLSKDVLRKVVYDSGIELNMEVNGYGKLFCAENRNKYPENMWELQAVSGDENSMGIGKGFAFLTSYGALLYNKSPLLNCSAKVGGHLVVGANMLMSGAPYYGYWDDDRRAVWNMTGGLRFYPGCKLGNGIYNPKPNEAQYPHAFAINWNEKKGYTIDYNWVKNKHTFRDAGNFASGNMNYNFSIKITKYRYNDRDSMHVKTSINDFNNPPRNFTVMRFADVVLMYAEACYKSSGDASDPEALKWMNKIRDRARGWYNDFDARFGLIPEGYKVGDLIPAEHTPTLPVYTSISMDDIMAERKWELCYESVRWFDLVRTGRLAETYNNYHPVGAGDFTHRTNLDDHDYLFPLPSYELNQSLDKEKFFQNPGY